MYILKFSIKIGWLIFHINNWVLHFHANYSSEIFNLLKINFIVLSLLIKILTCHIFLLLILNSCVFPQKSKNYELESISFNGNNSFSASALSEVILSKATPWWGLKFLNSFTAFGTPPVYFDSALVPIDANAIKIFYESNGFFMVSIDTKFDMDSSSNSASLIFNIEEKKPSIIIIHLSTGLIRLQ